MKFKSPLLVVRNMQKSRLFYKEVLGLNTVSDFGVNVVLSGGIALQTYESWVALINKEDAAVVSGGNCFELYFEEVDFDAFIQKLSSNPAIEYIHPVHERQWGQRVVRFYDPDHHIIEVGENLTVVCRRFLDSGMPVPEVAHRMGMDVSFVYSCMPGPRQKGAARRQTYLDD